MIDIGSAILNFFLGKILEKLIPSRSVSGLHETKWELAINKDGIQAKYYNSVIELTDKQIISLFQGFSPNENPKLFLEKIKKINTNNVNAFQIESKGEKHSIGRINNQHIGGTLTFKEKLSYDDIFKRVFLRRETIEIHEVILENNNGEYSSAIESLNEQLSSAKTVLLAATDQMPKVFKCKATFETVDSKNIFYDYEVELSLFDYTNTHIVLGNHLEEAPSQKFSLKLPKSNNIQDVKFTFSLTDTGSKDVNSLIQFNTLQRLFAKQGVRLTIKHLETDIRFFTGIISMKVIDYPELEREMEILNTIKKTEEVFGIKFNITDSISVGDYETLDKLNNLFDEKVIKAVSRGPVSLVLKPNSSHGVLSPIEGGAVVSFTERMVLFNKDILGVSQVITFSHLREIGTTATHRIRHEDGSLEIILNQFGDRKVEIRYIKTEDVASFVNKNKK